MKYGICLKGTATTLLTLVIVLAALSHSTEDTAQAQIPSPGSGTQVDRKALEVKLNNQLRQKAYKKLTRTLTRIPATTKLDWLRSKMLEGQTILISMSYVSNLWGVSKATKASDPITASKLKDAAGLVAIYALLVSKIDGLKCDDPSAPAKRKQRLLLGFRPVYQHVMAMPEVKRERILSLALKMEAKLAPKRPNDYPLCSYGAKHMTYNLKGRTISSLQQSGNSKLPGKNYLVPDRPGFVPGFLPKKNYARDQAKIRKQFPKYLAGLFKQQDR